MCVFLFASVLCAGGDEAPPKPATVTQNVIFVTFDGLRHEEVFTGAEESLLNKERGGVENVAEIRKRFWRPTAEERRAELLPFVWKSVVPNGQLFGNHRKNCVVRVTNKRNFSYPGYNELLTGFADDRIDSNDKKFNPNVTVLEWLHAKPAFRGRVAAATSWDVFPWIVNTERSGIPVNGGYKPFKELAATPTGELLNRLSLETPLFGEGDRNDALTFEVALAYLKAKKPRLLYVSFDETDAQGHKGRYDRVLDSAQKNDRFVRELWNAAQAMPEYRGKTSLVVSTDHGRGGPPIDWKNHSAKIPGSEFVWIAVMGPDTPPLGERANVDGLTQGQVAATLAALLGEDYRAAQPKAAPALPESTRPKTDRN